MATATQRSVEEIQAEVAEVEAALLLLLQEQRELQENQKTVLEEPGLLDAALAGKPLGTRSRMRQLIDRQAELPALRYALERRALELRIQLAEARLVEAEEERRAAIPRLDEAQKALENAQVEYNIAQGEASAAYEARNDARQLITRLRGRLFGLEQNKPSL